MKILAAIGVAAFAMSANAQTPEPFTLQQILSAPYALDLSAAPVGNTFAWVENSEGSRNIWIGGPHESARKITPYTEDDAQDINGMVWSPDATSIAYAYLWIVAIESLCASCDLPSNALGYLSYFAGAMYLMIAWTGAYVGIKLARQLQHEKETALQAVAIAQQAQLRMLRYQLNPHFLFNTLNAISTLILDGRREQANGMVGALSGFLRYSLESDPEQKVSLATEIRAAKRYLAIEQLRFGDRLKVCIDVPAEVSDAHVPSLILQPLIENAVKYAVSRNEAGGTIEIAANKNGAILEISVTDDGPGSTDYRPNKGEGGGVGLANTRERLRVLYGADHTFSIHKLQPHGTAAHLRFPFQSASNEESPCASPR